MKHRSDSYAAKPEMLDPDVRFLLANERTLLAWLRTALGLIAGGIVLLHLGNQRSQLYIGLLAVFFGVIASVAGYGRYKAADAAIRAGVLPPAGIAPTVIVVCVILFAGALIITSMS